MRGNQFRGVSRGGAKETVAGFQATFKAQPVS